MTSYFGLSEADLAAVVTILQKHEEVEEACIYGSRAKGNYKNGSDVDIAVKGTRITHKVITSISFELNEETTMPYHFDVVNFDTISNKDLVDHINRIGATFYKKANANA